jgi:hypothetical protein
VPQAPIYADRFFFWAQNTGINREKTQLEEEKTRLKEALMTSEAKAASLYAFASTRTSPGVCVCVRERESERALTAKTHEQNSSHTYSK